MNRRNLVIAAAIAPLFLLPGFAAARNKKAQLQGEALIQHARKLSDIRAIGSVPFHLHARFRFAERTENPIAGTYSLDWASPTRWREQVETSNFHEVKVGAPGKVWLLRSTKYKPLVTYRLEDALGFYGRLRLLFGEDVTSLRQTDASKTACLEKRVNKWTKYKMCFDTNSGVLVQEEDPPSMPKARSVFDFRDYRAVGSQELFPWEISETEKGVVTLRVVIDTLTGLRVIRPSVFNPPPGAVERPGCQDPDLPMGIKVINPHYPKSARKHHVQGVVSVSAYIGADGSIQDLKVLRTPSPDFASITLTTIRNKWKFKPASCSGQPVPLDVLVETAFWMR